MNLRRVPSVSGIQYVSKQKDNVSLQKAMAILAKSDISCS